MRYLSARFSVTDVGRCDANKFARMSGVFMSKQALELLPSKLQNKSISSKEIVLPLEAAMEAINYLEAQNYLILGWEGWVKTPDGSATQGTVSLEDLSVQKAAKVCRETILEDSKCWATESKESHEQLHFCITVRI